MPEENKTLAKPVRVKTPMGNVRARRGNRTGFTTGACSAAAARAATLGLINGEVPQSVICLLPNKQEVSFVISESKISGDGVDAIAKAVVIKDAGDDPDATDKAHLTVEVSLINDISQIGKVILKGGSGVGKVTKEGLGLVVGNAAINPVPRENIEMNVRTVAEKILKKHGLQITISVPGGCEIAKKTLNARLGIIGGISILGTTGIVRPYSTAAFRASVVQAVEMANYQAQKQIVFTTGGRTEKFAMRELPKLSEVCFVQMGDFVQTAFKTAIKKQMTNIYIGAMVGKLTKMCQGVPVTHAWRSEIDRDLLADIAIEVGAPKNIATEIRGAETARFAAENLMAIGLEKKFHRALAIKAIQVLKKTYAGDYHLVFLVCGFNGNLICRVDEEEAT